eukprot:6479047-Amphidinium_carterae.2
MEGSSTYGRKAQKTEENKRDCLQGRGDDGRELVDATTRTSKAGWIKLVNDISEVIKEALQIDTLANYIEVWAEEELLANTCVLEFSRAGEDRLWEPANLAKGQLM